MKSEAKSFGINSTSTIHTVYATSGEYPGKERTIVGKNICQSSSSASPYAMKFEGRSNEETERQQRSARNKAWNFAKNINKVRGKTRPHSTFQRRLLPAASTKEPEEREFVVDSVASMHMVSKKDLNSTELETMRTSRSPTTVMTANGEVQTREEATVYVKHWTCLSKLCFMKKLPQFFPWETL